MLRESPTGKRSDTANSKWENRELVTRYYAHTYTVLLHHSYSEHSPPSWLPLLINLSSFFPPFAPVVIPLVLTSLMSLVTISVLTVELRSQSGRVSTLASCSVLNAREFIAALVYTYPRSGLSPSTTGTWNCKRLVCLSVCAQVCILLHKPVHTLCTIFAIYLINQICYTFKSWT